jgi:CcmD family protein
MRDSRFTISGVRWFGAAVLLAIGLSASVPAQAQPPQATPAVPAATDQFVPMSEAAPREELPATPLVFYAYAFVWVALIGYVFLMWRRMARVEQDLAAVQLRLRDGAGGR